MVLQKILSHLNSNNKNRAFFIEEKSYSYADLNHKIAGIQDLLIQNKLQKGAIVTVNVYDDLETYAAILAIWFLGATFVPINTKHAKKRNNLIENQIDYSLKLSSNIRDENCIYIKGVNAKNKIINKSFKEQILYILFTSGSTGIPKGVPISKENLNYFITDFNQEYTLDHKDKFLQIYDLTFDASIHCYVLPLFLGASVFTVSPNKIKYLEAYKLMEQQEITFAKFPPSVLTYLQNFFNRIKLLKLKYSLLGGESLHANLALKWQKCIPNASIFNVYGPTEATINTHLFNFSENYNSTKHYNEIVSIGKPFGHNKAIVIDKNNQILPAYQKGELALSGKQITNGYYQDSKKNKVAFTNIGNQIFYKTGDLAYQDKDGDFLYCGRMDYQIQIQGYRVELLEIEQLAKQYKNAVNYAVVSVNNALHIPVIFLFTEKLKASEKELLQFLKDHLATYMVPSKIIVLDKFPLTSGGKVNYNALKLIATQHV